MVINGDVINGGCDSELEVKQALNHVVQPMESRQIPWAVTFGNHDEDLRAEDGHDRSQDASVPAELQYNVNADSTPGLTGTSNSQLLGQASRTKAPAFGLWLIDTGRYAPDAINGQDFAGYPDWDWVRMDQVTWYRNQSIATEQKYGKKIPSLMWGHIALHEHRNMWFASLDSADRGRPRPGVDQAQHRGRTQRRRVPRTHQLRPVQRLPGTRRRARVLQWGTTTSTPTWAITTVFSWVTHREQDSVPTDCPALSGTGSAAHASSSWTRATRESTRTRRLVFAKDLRHRPHGQ